jgi:hypothetical protein
MAMFQITCIGLPPGSENFEAITHLGGEAWGAPVAAVIADIEEGRNVYYVRHHGNNYLVSVVPGARGKHLRTRAEGKWVDLLLELPKCPDGTSESASA